MVEMITFSVKQSWQERTALLREGATFNMDQLCVCGVFIYYIYGKTNTMVRNPPAV